MLSVVRSVRFSYSLVCYFLAVGSLVYFILFVNDLWLENTVNSIGSGTDVLHAVVINLFAIGLFGIQHSVMARQSFKEWLAKFLDPSVERSTYCLFTALVIAAMCHLWVPFGELVWQVENESMVWLIRAAAFFGWTFLLTATFMLDHFELFGLSQTFLPLRRKPMPVVRFRTPGLYKLVRHPIQTGVLIGMWFVPVATTSHLLFAGGMTVYIFVGLYLEEKDLIREFGESYRQYKQKVKGLIPFVV